jgi:hypothetical protein
MFQEIQSLSRCSHPWHIFDESNLHLFEFNARAGKASAVTATIIEQSAQTPAVSIRRSVA